ncbi:hypothetical protein KZZ52_02125 [Dactylosporangium sp. AC04546]|uniref:hypothetical protein n=1 Tax=Dactylosporangium sp. AC04546 TaxID=2862460 RepID=UPI001EE0C8E7|nr:hypothetical protein [Dactylosporangium sp. AC04546]WVK84257.1 hypothetical protein KZZ52_02125 [Dactylosporangium sp. AC04546]
MNDIDPIFVSALRERAEGAVHVEQLLAASRRRGVRRVRTRKVLLTSGAAAAVLAVALTATLIPRPHTTPPPPTTTSSAQPPSPSPSPSAPPLHRPAVNSTLSPLTTTGKVGEGLQIHLDTVDPQATQLFWTSAENREVLQVFRGDESSNEPYIAYTLEVDGGGPDFRDSLPDKVREQDLTIRGRPATLLYTENRAWLRFVLESNAFAQVSVAFRDAPVAADTIRASVLDIVSWLRADHVLTCTVPFRLTWAPQGARTEGCGTSTGTSPLPDSVRQTSWIQLPSGGTFAITAFPRGAAEAVDPNRTYAGRQLERGPDLWKIDIDGRTYGLDLSTAALTEDQLMHILTSVVPAEPRVDPLAR